MLSLCGSVVRVVMIRVFSGGYSHSNGDHAHRACSFRKVAARRVCANVFLCCLALWSNQNSLITTSSFNGNTRPNIED